MVNKDNPLSLDYISKDMVKPKILFIESATEEEKYMQKQASEAVEELIKDASKSGIELIGTSAYRSYNKQQEIYENNVNIRGQEEADKYAAHAGKSEHQTGLAIDITNKERWFDKSTKEAQWLANNAHRFGFILRYPEGKEDITGYNYEPWHIRYVGKDNAEKIYREGITLEEYRKQLIK